MKIGLTGSIACGKSTVSAFLRELSYPVVDADAISHALTAPGGQALSAIRAVFGDGVFTAEGALERRELGRIVFASPDKRAQLNAILHPMILEEIDRQLHAYDAPGHIVFGDVPLLYECSMEARFDRIWVVSAARETQIERLCARDGLSRDEALQRIESQMPLEEKCRRADQVIHTDGSIAATQALVLELLRDPAQRRQA